MIREEVITQVMKTRNSKKVVLVRLAGVRKSLKVHNSSFFGKHCHECNSNLSLENMVNDEGFYLRVIVTMFSYETAINGIVASVVQSFEEFK